MILKYRCKKCRRIIYATNNDPRGALERHTARCRGIENTHHSINGILQDVKTWRFSVRLKFFELLDTHLYRANGNNKLKWPHAMLHITPQEWNQAYRDAIRWTRDNDIPLQPRPFSPLAIDEWKPCPQKPFKPYTLDLETRLQVNPPKTSGEWKWMWVPHEAYSPLEGG